MLLFNKPTAISYISKSGDKVYPVVIDIKEGVKSSETLSFMTADSNTGILSVAFMEGETIYNIDGATVVCDIERPDGTDISIGAVKVADGVVEVPLGVNGTSQPGMYMFDFKIARPGSKTIGVPLVSYTVTQSINTDEIVTQDDRLPVLNDLIVKIQNATSASTQATNECNKATQDSITATNNSIQATNNVNNAMKSINNAIASGTVDLELKQVRTSLNGTLHPTANDRINQMETHLLEATATTVETENSFTTVDATSNGYFEDVKLEGKTLVNMYNNSYIYATTGVGNYVRENNGVTVNNTSENGEYYILLNDSINVNPNTLYTLIIDIETSNNYQIYTWLDNSFKLFGYGNSNTKFAKTFTSGKESTKFRFDSDTLGGTVKFKNITILEGDHTNNPPEYFEGLMSVGQDVEEVSVESTTKNVITTISNAHSVKPIYTYPHNSEIHPYLQYFTEVTNYNTCNNVFEFYYLQEGGLWINLGTFDKKEALKVLNKRIAECEGNLNTKPLLYFNPTTETWEKPILREWDTIEKHSDGKYYYHKRSGEVVLNGSENWTLETNTGYLYTSKHDMVRVDNYTDKLLCDKFNTVINKSHNLNGITGYGNLGQYPNQNWIYIKHSNFSDVESIKAWLKANPTTLVYQLAKEEVYECTNIDLMTYSGETNYIINSGAISPKSLLKVHNNISNVVKILQEKVSLLENTFIAGLKSVLSGDMYSLATILYPEDFEQNDNTEQDIMVIPE